MRWMALALIGIGLLAATPLLACDGDCDGNGTISIDELVLGVQIALDGTDVGRCAALDLDHDGQVSVSELIAAVDAALNGCVAPTPTPTPDPGLINCGDGVVNGSEECDDGNHISGDGCSADCMLEPGGNPCAGIPAFPGVAATTVLITDALVHPVHIGAPRLDTHRIFIVGQEGQIRVVKDGVLLTDSFLDIADRISTGGERGLLSIAFHPDYATNGRFFVDYTNTDGNTVIARYQVGSDADHADRDSEQIILTIDKLYPNHNGGQLAFGPDGYLYAGPGDGGSEGDPDNKGQRDDTLLGKMLRIGVDVDSPPYYRIPPDNPHADRGDPLGLVWAKGIRNPWRFSFDRATGDLYIADVGQDRFEEIDVQPAASHGGENYGWRVFEGNACYNPDPAPQCPNPPDGYTFPVLQYAHSIGCSVTGGFVYRGCALPDLRGQYFYSDYCTGFLHTFALVNGAVSGPQDRTAALAPGGGHQISSVVSFGEDARGELYIADYVSGVYKVVPVSQ